MKLLLSIVLFSNFFAFCSGQVEDSLYVVKEESKFLEEFKKRTELNHFLDSLSTHHYYQLKIDSVTYENSITTYFIDKGKKFESPTVVLDSIGKSMLPNFKNYKNNVDLMYENLKNKITENGYSFGSLSSRLKNDTLYIYTHLNLRKYIDDIIIKSNDKIAKGYKNQLKNQFVGRVFNEQRLEEINQLVSSNRFLENAKPAQVLFLEDSTLVYIYPKKKKKSYFDGVLGFSNSEQEKLKLTGNIDLNLGNVFNSFETIKLHWNSAVNNSQNLNILLDFPYLGGSRIGSRTNLDMLRQDSTFVNFGLSESLYYSINYKTKIGINGLLQSSTYIPADSINVNLNYQDFRKSGFGLRYEYQTTASQLLFENTTLVELWSNLLKVNKQDSDASTQYHLFAKLQQMLELNPKNYLLLEGNYENLLSDEYSINELIRLGGLYSMRGFNENSILTNEYWRGVLEYRYLPNEAIYFDAFWEFGNFTNSVIDQSQFLWSLGAGLNFLTKAGIFNLQIATGKYPNVPFRFQDTRINIGIRALF